MLYNIKKIERLLIMKKKEKKAKTKVELTPEEAAQKDASKVLATKCIAAILCAVIVCISLSSAFGKLAEAVKEKNSVVVATGGTVVDSAPADDTADDGTIADVPAADDGTATDAPAADDSTAPTDAPAADDSTAPTNAPAADTGKNDGNKAPSSTQEVVAYFNTAVNKVKTSAKSVEQKSVTNYLASSATISSGIKGVYNMLGGDDWLNEQLQKNGQGAATYSTKADIQAKFPVEGETWASKLTVNDVKSATCKVSGDTYTITIVTKADAKSDSFKHGQGYNPKAFNVVLPGVINENIPGIAKNLVGTASMNYPSSTVVITVDAKTGNVQTANYDLKWTINFDKMGIILPFGTKSVYNVKW